MTCIKGDLCNYPSCNCKDIVMYKTSVWIQDKFYCRGDTVLAHGQKWYCTKTHTSLDFKMDSIDFNYWEEYCYD